MAPSPRLRSSWSTTCKGWLAGGMGTRIGGRIMQSGMPERAQKKRLMRQIGRWSERKQTRGRAESPADSAGQGTKENMQRRAEQMQGAAASSRIRKEETNGQRRERPTGAGQDKTRQDGMWMDGEEAEDGRCTTKVSRAST